MISAALPVVGGVLGLMGSKGSSPTTTTPTQTVNQSQQISGLVPNAAAMPLYGFLAGQGMNLAQQPPQYYPGQTYVAPSGLTQMGVDRGASAQEDYLTAAGYQREMAGDLIRRQQAQQAQVDLANRNYGVLSNAADVANNPYVQGMMGANEQAVTDVLMRQWMPQIRSQSIGVNAMGSSRQGIREGLALGEAAKALSSQNAATQMQAYGQGLVAQQSALGYAGQQIGNQLTPALTMGLAGQARGQAGAYGMQGAQNLLGIGQTVEGYQNAALQDQMNRYNFYQQQPWDTLGRLQSVLQTLQPIGQTYGNLGGATAGQVTTQNPEYQTPLQGALGGALTGYGLYNQFQRTQPTPGQYGALTGSSGAGASLGMGSGNGGTGFYGVG